MNHGGTHRVNSFMHATPVAVVFVVAVFCLFLCLCVLLYRKQLEEVGGPSVPVVLLANKVSEKLFLLYYHIVRSPPCFSFLMVDRVVSTFGRCVWSLSVWVGRF